MPSVYVEQEIQRGDEGVGGGAAVAVFGLANDRVHQRFARRIIEVDPDDADMDAGAALENAEHQMGALVGYCLM